MGGVGDAADDYWLRGRDGVGADGRVMWAFTLAAGCAAAIAADAAATTVDTAAADAPLPPLHSRCAVDVAADAAAAAATIVNPAATDAPAVATGLPLRCRRCVPTAVAGAADVAAAAAAATVTAATVDAAAGTRCPQRMRGRVTPRPHVRVAARERDAQVRRTTAVMVSGGERDARRTKLSLGAEWTDGGAEREEGRAGVVGRVGEGRGGARICAAHPFSPTHPSRVALCRKHGEQWRWPRAVNQSGPSQDTSLVVLGTSRVQ